MQNECRFWQERTLQICGNSSSGMFSKNVIRVNYRLQGVKVRGSEGNAQFDKFQEALDDKNCIEVVPNSSPTYDW